MRRIFQVTDHKEEIMKNIKLGLVIATGIVLVVACAHTASIVNISNAPIQTGSGQKPSLAAVGKAITNAGESLGWKMRTVTPGTIEGALNWNVHTAVVLVTYNTENYSINYKNSENLKYDGTKVHKNYNLYVMKLDRGIQAQLKTL